MNFFHKLSSKIFFSLFLLAFLLAFGFLAGARPTAALGLCLPNLLPPLGCFGGPILAILPPIPFVCWVPQFVIGPPKPSVVAVVPGISQVYLFFALHPGALVAGITFPPIPFLCDTADIVLKIGTSI